MLSWRWEARRLWTLYIWLFGTLQDLLQLKRFPTITNAYCVRIRLPKELHAGVDCYSNLSKGMRS